MLLAKSKEGSRLIRKVHYSLFVCKYNTHSAKVKLSEIPHVCSSAEWNTIIQESRAILQKYPPSPSHGGQELTIVSTQTVIERLQKFPQQNYLVDTFKQLLANTEVNASELRWPGLVTLMLAKSVGNPFHVDNFISKSLEDVIWSTQITLAEIINLLYSNLIFQKECFRVASSRNLKNPKTSYSDIKQLVNNYFTASVFRKIPTLKNEKVLYLLAKVLETLNKTTSGSQEFCLYHNLQDWEHQTFYSRGILLSSACLSTLELAGFDENFQHLAFEFGYYFTLAIKANADLQQLWNYQNSQSSIINVKSFPVALHLAKYPETLAYLYRCPESFDNLEYHTLNDFLTSNSGIEEAQQQLTVYVHKACNILESLENKNTEMNSCLKKLVQTLKTLTPY